jgi:hypothetical protein
VEKYKESFIARGFFQKQGEDYGDDPDFMSRMK